MGFPGGLEGRASACNEGDPGSIPGLGRSLGEGNGNPLQYSCLENPMDRAAWWATVHGVAKSQTRLSSHFTSYMINEKYKKKKFNLKDTKNQWWLLEVEWEMGKMGEGGQNVQNSSCKINRSGECNVQQGDHN